LGCLKNPPSSNDLPNIEFPLVSTITKEEEEEEMTQPIPIIGAGLAGLTLSRTLLHHNIPSILYEKAPKAGRRNNYAITLHKTAYQPLLSILGLDEHAFKRRVAVDAETGGLGSIARDVNVPSHGGLYDTTGSFRANRARLEEVLGEGVEIRWEYAVEGVEVGVQQEEGEGGGRGVKLKFHNGKETSSAKLVVGADGVHSTVRKLLVPSAVAVEILPYAVFNGKYKVDGETFAREYYASAPTRESNLVSTTHNNKCALSVSINDSNTDHVYINWTFSRPPLCNNDDPLHRPSRSLQDAKLIPEDLFNEARALSGLQPPFSAVFDPDRMRNDRILHWLMRTTAVPLRDLQTLFSDSGVCLMGDAIHAEPILGGNGANAAIVDGVTLAEAIAGRASGSGVETWYTGRYGVWKRGVEESVRAIGDMHHAETQMSANL